MVREINYLDAYIKINRYYESWINVYLNN